MAPTHDIPTNSQIDLAGVLGLAGLSGEELEVMLENIGSLIMESVLLRSIGGMTEEEAAALDSYVSTNPSPEDLYDYLTSKVPDLDTIFDEESTAFREECARIFGNKTV